MKTERERERGEGKGETNRARADCGLVAAAVIGVQVPVKGGRKARWKESPGGHFSERGGHSDNWHGKIKYIFIRCQIADEMGPIH